MSLIPSESLSFPDDFSRAITRARALSEARATAAVLNARSKKRARAEAPKPAPEPTPRVELPEQKPVATRQPPLKSAPIPKEIPVELVQPIAVAPIIPPPPVEPEPPAQVLTVPVLAVAEPLPLEPLPVVVAKQSPAMPPVEVPAMPPAAPVVVERPAIPQPLPAKISGPKPIVGKAFRAQRNMMLEEFDGLRPMEPTFSGPVGPQISPKIVRENHHTPVHQPPPPKPMALQPELLGQPLVPVAAPAPVVRPVQPAPMRPQPILVDEVFAERPPPPMPPRMPFNVRDFLAGLRFPKLRLPKRHLSRKWVRFLVVEGIALSVLIPTAAMALTHFFHDPIMVFIMNIVTIAAASAAGVVPIMFFAVGPTLPRSER